MADLTKYAYWVHVISEWRTEKKTEEGLINMPTFAAKLGQLQLSSSRVYADGNILFA